VLRQSRRECDSGMKCYWLRPFKRVRTQCHPARLLLLLLPPLLLLRLLRLLIDTST